MNKLHLINNLLKDHQYLKKEVLDNNGLVKHIDIEKFIKYSGLSSGEKFLVQLSLDFLNNTGSVLFIDIFNVDSSICKNVLDTCYMKIKKNLLAEEEMKSIIRMRFENYD